MRPLPVPPQKLYFNVIGGGLKDRELGFRPKWCLRAVGKTYKVGVSFKWQLPSPPQCPNRTPIGVVRPMGH